MAKLPAQSNTTIDAIYKAYENNQESGWRKHLGASVIGHECLRKAWYSFRWALPIFHNAKTLRIFEAGHYEESLMIKNLRDAGFEGSDKNETGDQYRFSDIGGHFGGSIDGVIKGIPEAPRTWHLFEAKAIGDKYFKQLLKLGVRAFREEYYTQMSIYMKKMDLTRALFMAINRDTRELYTERIKADELHADRHIARAKNVIESPEPLSRMQENPSFFKCKWCDYYDLCFSVELPAVNCRTCTHSTPVMTGDGDWHCARIPKIKLSDGLMNTGCDEHIFLPPLLLNRCGAPASQNEHGCVIYKNNGNEFMNEPGGRVTNLSTGEVLKGSWAK